MRRWLQTAPRSSGSTCTSCVTPSMCTGPLPSLWASLPSKPCSPRPRRRTPRSGMCTADQGEQLTAHARPSQALLGFSSPSSSREAPDIGSWAGTRGPRACTRSLLTFGGEQHSLGSTLCIQQLSLHSCLGWSRRRERHPSEHRSAVPALPEDGECCGAVEAPLCCRGVSSHAWWPGKALLWRWAVGAAVLALAVPAV